MDIFPPLDYERLTSWVEQDICPVIIFLPKGVSFVQGYDGAVDWEQHDERTRKRLMVALIVRTGTAAWGEFDVLFGDSEP